MSCQGYRGYISTHMQERSVPQSVQQLVIREYCKKNDLKFLLSATEYGDGFKMLESLLQDKSINGIVLYSIFQLPYDNDRRKGIYFRALMEKKKLFFAAENMAIETTKNADKLEDIFLLRKILYGNH